MHYTWQPVCQGRQKKKNGVVPVAEVQVLVIKGDEDVSDEGGEGGQGPPYHLGPGLLDDHLMHPLSISPLRSTEAKRSTACSSTGPS